MPESTITCQKENEDGFYELCPLREGLLNWYPFQKESKILQFSDGFGGLTKILSSVSKHLTVIEPSKERVHCIAERCKDCMNIEFAVSSNELPADVKYDYIVVEKAINTRTEIDQVLKKANQLLRETGRLLFVCENRFGMKYWCGVPDTLDQIPFAGIRDYGRKNRMTRRDLIEVLNQIEWIKGWNLYYPFPDHKLAQAVYTDYYLPTVSVRDRVIPYYRMQEQESLVCLEDEISDALIANRVFHIFANSFFVECGKQEFKQEIIYAALSTDRGKEHGFATVITSYGTVHKKVLHSDGKKSLAVLHQNRTELNRRGINCVQEKLLEDSIEMPYIHKPVLIEYLKSLFQDFQHKEQMKEKVIEIFEKIYNAVRKSSETVDFSECMISDKRLTKENAGIILKKAYIDMIPYNCFYDNGCLLFYDQEFSRDYFPAKYVLFRALRYTYCYIPEAQSIIPLQFFKDKFRFGTSWQVYERIEAEFVEDNRNYEQMRTFYLWASANSNTVDKNIEKLTGKIFDKE